jgi:hypothetical protein
MWTLLALAASAAPMALSARVLGADGAPVAGPVDLVVAVYATEAAASAEWSVVLEDVPSVDGAVSVLVDPPAAALVDGEAWVGLTVGGVAIGPRRRLLAVPAARGFDRVPVLSSEPFACAAARLGALYFDATLGQLRVCGVGPAWAGA